MGRVHQADLDGRDPVLGAVEAVLDDRNELLLVDTGVEPNDIVGCPVRIRRNNIWDRGEEIMKKNPDTFSSFYAGNFVLKI